MSASDEPALDLAAIRAVGLDLMDTLIRDPWRDAVERVIGMGVEESRPLRDRECWADFEHGHIDEDEWGRRFFLPESGYTLDLARLKKEFSLGYWFVPGMEELALRLSRRVPVHVMSNYPPWYDEVRERFVLDRFVSGHHPSYVVGARKPAADYFERVLARIGIAPHELLFVDDVADNVAGARAVGCQALLFCSAADLAARVGPLLESSPADR